MTDKSFFVYANEAASKIREINRLVFGTEDMEMGGLLGGAYYCIADMVQTHLAPVVGEKVHSDKLNGITSEIMFAEKDEIGGIVKGCCGQIE